MDKEHPWVSIIVANYNGKHFLKDCMDSLSALNYPPERLEIIVVDNCSEDGSIEFLYDHYPRVIVLKNDVNNYCRANNLGFRTAQGEFVAFVNNDIQLHTNWLLELIKVMRQKKSAGVLGGKILFLDNRIQSAGHEEYPNFYWGDRGFKEEDRGQYENSEEVGSLCGAAVLFRRACFEDVGGLDEDFIMYLEDVDICFRCKEKNWKIFYVPQSLSWHRFSGTSKARAVMFFSERNRLLLLAKHFPEKLADALYGKGYFVGNEDDSVPQSIFDILPIVLSKLPERQNEAKMKDILPGLFKELGRMANLEKNILIKRLEESKESSLAQLQQQGTDLALQLETAKAALGEKESLLTQAGQKNSDLVSQIEAARAVISEKESLLAQARQENANLTSQFEKVEVAIHAQKKKLASVAYELEMLKGDWERITNLEKKAKYLIIKPFHTSVEATELVIRAIKRKHPQAAIYLFANLIKDDYEKLLKNDTIDKKIFFSPGKNKLSFFAFLKEVFLFRLVRFDFAVIPVSPGGGGDYQGYRKAKMMALLSGAKSRHSCQVG